MKFSGEFASTAIFAAFGVAAMAVADIGPFSSLGQMARTSSSLSQGVVGAVTPVVTLGVQQPGNGAALPGVNVNGVQRIRQPQIDLVVTVSPEKHGKVTFKIGGQSIGGVTSLDASRLNKNIDLSSIENTGPTKLTAEVDFGEAGILNSIGEYMIRYRHRGPPADDGSTYR
ncbi:MAG: hypothetical protein ACKVHE_26165 [Planctomycetales bacterium]